MSGRRYTCYCRFFNAVYNTRLNLYINGIPAEEGLGYGDFTNYLPAKPGVYNIKAQCSDTSEFILDFDTDTLSDVIYTIALTGEKSSPALRLIGDRFRTGEPGSASVRFVGFTSNTGGGNSSAYKAYLNGIPASGLVGEYSITDFTPVVQGKYKVELKKDGIPVCEKDGFKFGDGRFYSCYVLEKENAAPEICAALEGLCYLPRFKDI